MSGLGKSPPGGWDPGKWTHAGGWDRRTEQDVRHRSRLGVNKMAAENSTTTKKKKT